MNKSNLYIKSRIIVPFLVAMITLVASALVSVTWFYNSSIERSAQEKSLVLLDSFQSLIGGDAELLTGLLELIVINNESVQVIPLCATKTEGPQ